MHWRKLLRAVHRDLGYCVTALTLAYAVSGVAVNHIEDWNPNYSFEEVVVEVGALPQDSYDAMQHHVVQALALDPEEIKGRFLESEAEFRVFLPEGQEVTVDPRSGRGLFKRMSTHPLVYEANVLHLNALKGLWTWVADAFALSLVVLAITGLLLNRGRNGLGGRGKWFMGAGLLVPLGFIAYMYWG